MAKAHIMLEGELAPADMVPLYPGSLMHPLTMTAAVTTATRAPPRNATTV